MYIIRKEFACSSAHKLSGLPPEHPCSRPHGHNYIIVAELSSVKLNAIGFVQDYRELDDIKKWIDDTMDHRDLNQIFVFNPTAENMAKHIFDKFKDSHPLLSAIEVSETPKTNARYTPDHDGTIL